MNKKAIYGIICKPTGKIYIGSTKNCRKRKNAHFQALKNKQHFNPLLQNAWNKYGEDDAWNKYGEDDAWNKYGEDAWNKYGEDAFVFEILEDIHDEDMLIIKEIEWIQKTNSLDKDHGFNLEDPSKPNQRFSKDYIVRRPNSNEDIPVKNLTVFCEENNLIPQNMSAVALGKYDDHAGWHCRYPDMTYLEWEEYRNSCRKKKWIWWVVTHRENGLIITTRNLSQFCRENNLRKMSMINIARGNQKEHRGWHCRKQSETMEQWEEKYQKIQSAKPSADAHKIKSYILTTPDKIELEVTNLTEFCTNHNLVFQNMSSIASGTRDSHQGWHCRHADMTMEQWQELRKSK